MKKLKSEGESKRKRREEGQLKDIHEQVFSREERGRDEKVLYEASVKERKPQGYDDNN